jgi:Zinc dependent phospholipase C
MNRNASSTSPNCHLRWRKSARCLLYLVCLLLIPRPARPYSVQTHEQLIDLLWKPSIEPLLLHRFPTLTPAQLKEAHAYAYGGCAIQDAGYYPFGRALFSDLTHYVRTGDFIESLFRNAKTPDELAFAIGALTHYVADTIGHSKVVNPSVPIEFPKLAKEYGPTVNYAQDPHAHVRTEFAFDINQLSKRRFAPSAYLKHVGLEVPEPLLTRAFFETYGLDISQIIGKRHSAVRSYRTSVRTFLPRVAYAEAVLHKNSFPPDTAGSPFDTFNAELAQADFENNWNQFRKKPGIGTYSLAGLIVILPKFGPLSMLAVRGPTPATEELYVEGLNNTILLLHQTLTSFSTIATTLTTQLPNLVLDTGQHVRLGTYRLTDDTYAELLHLITRNPSKGVPATLKQNILAFYADPTPTTVTKENPKHWAHVQSDLKILATMSTKAEPPPFLEEESN